MTLPLIYALLSILIGISALLQLAAGFVMGFRTHRILPQRSTQVLFPNRGLAPLHTYADRIYSSGESTSTDNSQSSLVLDDFDHILDAIYVYKKAFGDLNIPIKFEVPNINPWPTHLHGLRLGKRLEKLLSTPEFFDEYPDKVEELEKLGFKANLRSLVDDWDLIYEAMKVYKEIYGDLRIQSKFVVPNEDPWPRLTRKLKLGVRVAAMRSAGRYVKDHPERKSLLDTLGFEWRIRDNTYKQQVVEELFDQVYEALVVYQKNFGDLDVPSKFVIPEDTVWPESLWGFGLGAQVVAIRKKDKLVYGHEEREQKLNDLGFSWELTTPRAQFSKKRFEIIYEALKVYKELKGDLLIPQLFVVPEAEPWPEETWNLKLGARVNSIRGQGTLIANFPERRALLDDIGFVWDLPTEARRRRKKDDIADGDEDEDLRLTKGRTLKSEELLAGWDEEEKQASRKKIQSLSLTGRMVGDFKSAVSYEPSRMFEPVSYREIAAEAIREHLYSREFSSDPDIRNTAHFEGRFTPEEYHKAITRNIPQESVDMMKSIGYKILEFGPFNWQYVLDALRIYFEANGNIDVPHDYVITDDIIQESGLYNESFVGLMLGEAVAGLRNGDIDGLEDPERRDVLDAMDFDWSDIEKYQRYRFVPMLLGLQVFRHLYGFPLPRHDFIIPDAPQWPYWMTGMPLGEWVAVARVQQKMIEEYYPHRRDMLNAMEFLWWIPPGPVDKKYFSLPE